MEKNNRIVETDGGTRLRSGRIALGELTNREMKNRRKQAAVKKVVSGQRKRKDQEVAIENAVKKIKESIVKPVTYKGIQVHEVEVAKRTNCKEEISRHGYETTCAATRPVKTSDRITRSDRQKSTSTRNHCPDTLLHYRYDIHSYLLQLETRTSLPSDHLKDKKITDKMRYVIIDWLLEVQNHYKLNQETLELTAAVLDRCLMRDDSIDPNNAQLLCLAALFIAIKYEETFLLELSDLTYICDYNYCEKEIVDMERRVLETIDYNLSYPSTINFLGLYTKSGQDYMTDKLVTYYLDLSLLEYRMASVLPSKVACACLYVALCVSHASVYKSLDELSTYSLQDLSQAVIPLTKRALASISISKGGIFNKHLSDNKPGSLKDLIKNEIYSQILKEICQLFEQLCKQ